MNKTEFKAAFKEECGRPWFKKFIAQQVDAAGKVTKETATIKHQEKETATLSGKNK